MTYYYYEVEYYPKLNYDRNHYYGSKLVSDIRNFIRDNRNQYHIKVSLIEDMFCGGVVNRINYSDYETTP